MLFKQVAVGYLLLEGPELAAAPDQNAVPFMYVGQVILQSKCRLARFHACHKIPYKVFEISVQSFEDIEENVRFIFLSKRPKLDDCKFDINKKLMRNSTVVLKLLISQEDGLIFLGKDFLNNVLWTSETNDFY